MSYQDPITVSGSLVTFNDPDGDGRITNLSAAISPIQDLHGYDHPWPAGGGKNKFDVDKVVNTAGITVSNGVITVNGNAINSGKKLSELADLNVGETYILTGVTTVQENFIYLYGTGANVSWIFGNQMTMTQDLLNAVVFFYGGNNTTGQISNLMIRLSSVSDDTFAPYSNLCPITGWTGANVWRNGVNQWDEEWEIGGIVWSTGGNSSETGRIRSKNYIPVLPSTSYYFTPVFNKYVWFFDKDKNIITKVSGNNNFITMQPSDHIVTTPSNCYYIRFLMWTTYGTTYNNDISINYPSTDIGYHAYQGNVYPVTWQSEAGTVYGGTLDVVTGLLTVDKVLYTYTGNETVSARSGNYIPVKLGASGIYVTNDMICTDFEYVRVSANGWSYIQTTMTPAEMQTYLQNHTVSIVCELATPLTYQLTPTEVATLLGDNTIWADAGDVTVTYQLVRHGFEGWLIKVGTEQTEIPLNFIRYSTYKVTPDQRMEWSAERNVNGVLQRETVPNMPPKIEFNTKLLTNSDVTALMSILNKSFTVASERKLPVYFYDPENNTYKTWDCYMPDIDFKIRNVDAVKNIINYEELRFAFIGY